MVTDFGLLCIERRETKCTRMAENIVAVWFTVPGDNP
jgi:hypothetical protein